MIVISVCDEPVDRRGNGADSPTKVASKHPGTSAENRTLWIALSPGRTITYAVTNPGWLPAKLHDDPGSSVYSPIVASVADAAAGISANHTPATRVIKTRVNRVAITNSVHHQVYGKTSMLSPEKEERAGIADPLQN
jgi:hypothetical protein